MWKALGEPGNEGRFPHELATPRWLAALLGIQFLRKAYLPFILPEKKIFALCISVKNKKGVLAKTEVLKETESITTG